MRQREYKALLHEVLFPEEVPVRNYDFLPFMYRSPLQNKVVNESVRDQLLKDHYNVIKKKNKEKPIPIKPYKILDVPGYSMNIIHQHLQCSESNTLYVAMENIIWLYKEDLNPPLIKKFFTSIEDIHYFHIFEDRNIFIVNKSVYDLSTMTKVELIDQLVVSASWSLNNSNVLALASINPNAIVIHDRRTRIPVIGIKIQNAISKIKWANNSKTIAAATSDDVWIFNIDKMSYEKSNKIKGPVKAMEWIRDESDPIICAGGLLYESNIFSWDIYTKFNRCNVATNSQIIDMAWVANGNQMAVSIKNQNKGVMIINPLTGTINQTLFDENIGNPLSLGYFEKKNRIAMTTTNEYIVMWELKNFHTKKRKSLINQIDIR